MELLTLMGLLEGLSAADPALDLVGAAAEASWAALRRQVETATRKSELRVVEDQVDAVVCAYVALFAATRPDDIDDVRRLRDRLHRHPDPPGGAHPEPATAQGSDASRPTRCASTPPSTRRGSLPVSSSSRW